MKVDISFPPLAEATIEGVTENGQKVKLRSVTVTPVFWTPESCPNILFFESKDFKDVPIRRGIAAISGVTGRIRISDRTEPARRTKYDMTTYGQTPSEPGKRKKKKRPTRETSDE